MSDAISIQNLNVWFGEHHDLFQAVKNASLSVATGASFGLVGESGSGKSTILRALTGLAPQWEGQMSINGTDLTHKRDKQFYKTVQMVFQDPYASLHPRQSVDQVLSETLSLHGFRDIDDRVSKLLLDVGLGPAFRFRYPHQLSGGQRQRVAIGRAIVRDPEVFLFDEPLSNLDASLRVQTRLEIARLHERLGATMIYVTHDQVEAMTLADKIVVLRDGRIEQVGSPLELYERPQNAFVAQFIGSPKMNFFKSKDLAPGAQAQLSDQLTASHFIGIRPEHLRSCELGQAIVCGQIELVEQLGEYALVHLTGDQGAEFIVKMEHAPTEGKGTVIGLNAKPEHVHYFDAETELRVTLS